MSQTIKSTTRWAIYLRDHLRCTYCGISIYTLLEEYGVNFLTLDHVVSRKRGRAAGAIDHGPKNLVTCCYQCNRAKGPGTLKALCSKEGLAYATVKRRSAKLRLKPVECHRQAASILLGRVQGVPTATMVMDHDWLVKRQWRSTIELDVWEHYRVQLDAVCGDCGQAIPDQREEARRRWTPKAPPQTYGGHHYGQG